MRRLSSSEGKSKGHDWVRRSRTKSRKNAGRESPVTDRCRASNGVQASVRAASHRREIASASGPLPTCVCPCTTASHLLDPRTVCCRIASGRAFVGHLIKRDSESSEREHVFLRTTAYLLSAIQFCVCAAFSLFVLHDSLYRNYSI